MSNANTVAVFGSWDANDRVYTRLLDFSLGKPQRTRESYGGPGIDIAAGGPIDESAWVESRWTIEVKGTSVDDVSARIAALAAELRDLSTITVGLKGSDYTGTLIPKVAECVERPVTPISSVDFREVVEITILREPWVYGASETPYSSHAVTLPCVLDLSAMQGQAAAPLTVTVEATSADLHQLVIGVYPDAPTAVAKFVRKAVDLSWSGGSAAADSAGWPDGIGNTVWKTNSASGVSASVDVTDFVPGSYAVYANVRRDAGADPATIATSLTDPVAIESTDLRRQLLGIVSLPVTNVLGAATSSLGVTMTSDGTDYVYCTTIEIIPVGWSAVGWHHSNASGSADTLRFADGLVYADDAALLAYATLGARLAALGGTLVITGEGTTEAPTVAATVTVSYDPRWEQIPSWGGAPGPGI